MSKGSTVTVAIDRDTHREAKSLAATRGMKLVHVPGLLIEAWSLLSPDQRAAAFERFEARQKRQPAPAA